MKRIRETEHELSQLARKKQALELELSNSIAEQVNMLKGVYQRGRRIVTTFDDAERLGLPTLYPHGTTFQRHVYFLFQDTRVLRLARNSTMNEYFNEHCHVIYFDDESILKKCQETLDSTPLCVAYLDDEQQTGVCSTPILYWQVKQ